MHVIIQVEKSTSPYKVLREIVNLPFSLKIYFYGRTWAQIIL